MKVVVDGAEFPMPENFTFREMNFIKRMTGLRAGELYPALSEGDTDVIAAFAVTAMRREHPGLSEDAVLDLEIDQIELVEDEESVAGPPDEEATEPPAPEAES